MNADSASLAVRYYDGVTPTGSAATMLFRPRELQIIGERLCATYPSDWLQVSPRTGRADRFITLPDGGQLQCPDHTLLDRLPQQVASEGLVAWLEQRLAVAVACVVIVAATLIGAYVYGLPIAAKRIARGIPMETEQPLGVAALRWLDGHEWFTPSHLPYAKRTEIRRDFVTLCEGLPQQRYYRLEFRGSRFIGANAFAFPGGIIVITDDMVTLAQNENEVLAVLAHEIGHVELRHTMRHILQDSAAGAIAAAVTSDASTLTTAVAGLPVVLVQTKYSREFESEADNFAFALLKKHRISPLAFADIMMRLRKRHHGDSPFGFLSTHPLTSARIQRARAAAGLPATTAAGDGAARGGG